VPGEAQAAAQSSAPPPQAPIRSEPPAGAPALVVTGGVYSNNAAQRMLIVNGQVFSEGGQPAPGVMLEQIRPNSAVLSFGGSRFSVRY
jgi:general secretion pathway protein B